MTKKKRELIEILLDNVKPEDWPKNAVYAAQDKKTLTWGKWVLMFYSDFEIPHVNVGGESFVGEKVGREIKLPELCENWNKTIVHRDEFMNRWNERNGPVELKTPQQLALEKFGTDWHDNEGVQPVDDNVLIDAIVHGGALMRKYTWSALGLFKIKKWRVHSDQAALLREPMPLCSEEIPCRFVDDKSPLDTQIGGDHYTKLAIQPMRYSMENGLDALQHTVIKYVTRFRDKNGIEDLEKAKHCIDMLIEFEKESK